MKRLFLGLLLVSVAASAQLELFQQRYTDILDKTWREDFMISLATPGDGNYAKALETLQSDYYKNNPTEAIFAKALLEQSLNGRTAAFAMIDNASQTPDLNAYNKLKLVFYSGDLSTFAEMGTKFNADFPGHPGVFILQSREMTNRKGMGVRMPDDVLALVRSNDSLLKTKLSHNDELYLTLNRLDLLDCMPYLSRDERFKDEDHFPYLAGLYQSDKTLLKLDHLRKMLSRCSLPACIQIVEDANKEKEIRMLAKYPPVLQAIVITNEYNGDSQPKPTQAQTEQKLLALIAKSSASDAEQIRGLVRMMATQGMPSMMFSKDEKPVAFSPAFLAKLSPKVSKETMLQYIDAIVKKNGKLSADGLPAEFRKSMADLKKLSTDDVHMVLGVIGYSTEYPKLMMEALNEMSVIDGGPSYEDKATIDSFCAFLGTNPLFYDNSRSWQRDYPSVKTIADLEKVQAALDRVIEKYPQAIGPRRVKHDFYNNAALFDTVTKEHEAEYFNDYLLNFATLVGLDPTIKWHGDEFFNRSLDLGKTEAANYYLKHPENTFVVIYETLPIAQRDAIKKAVAEKAAERPDQYNITALQRMLD